MLSRSSPLYPLLKKNETSEKTLQRYRWMLGIHRDVAMDSVKFCADDLSYEFRSDIHKFGLSDEKSPFYKPNTSPR